MCYTAAMDENLQKTLRFLLEIDKMKSVYRKNILADGSRNETDAEHSWHMAVCAMALQKYAPKGTDLCRAIELCLVHDLVEVYAGDTFAFDFEAVKSQSGREKAAAKKLFSLLPEEERARFRALWEEFERGTTKEAIYAQALDRFQPLVLNLATDGAPWALCHATRSQVERRLLPVKTGMPALWDYVENELDLYVKRGFVAPDGEEEAAGGTRDITPDKTKNYAPDGEVPRVGKQT